MNATKKTLWGAMAGGVSLTLGALLITSCEGLDYSAGAEGTGVQIIGAIVVLAKYHASARQKAVAEERAHLAVSRVVQPIYEKSRAKAVAATSKRVENARHEYDQRIASASKNTTPSPAKTAPGAEGSEEVQRLKKEKEAALAKLQAEASAELASVDRDWRSVGAMPAPSKEGGKPSAAHIEESVPTPSAHDPEALLASARAHLPTYIAVSVPAQGNAAEAGGKATVMLWDTRRQRLASDDVLVLASRPSDGVDAKIDGVSAHFAMTGGNSQ